MIDHPDHLRPIEPAETVHALCDRIGAALPNRHSITWLELEAFRETRAPHDARRLANALRHITNQQDLADEVLALIPEATP
jgi:hypothetical protein